MIEEYAATHSHSHSHTHKQTKAVINRMARLIGHLQATKKMIEDGRDCSEILIQLSAVEAAIRAVSRVILKDHIEHCIVEAVEENDQESIDRLNQAIDQIMK
ncbi:MAG: metal-sensing transcriptional repressor [Selenomonadaceae bacterium]|nr:metal-sensing transcriptional repressor [Selenomonadaceae bacterium]